MTDRIEKSIEIAAPVARVWRALTDYQEFGEWFRVKLDGPFKTGEVSRGHITYPGYEHLKWEAVVQKMEPERLFSFTWHPYAIDPSVDYTSEPPTLVEFTLKPAGKGTLLTIVESGFDRIPPGRRPEAFRMNEGGWEEQTKNIARHAPRALKKAARPIAPAPVFAALGDETRLRLVGQLSKQSPQSIASLTQHSEITRQAISKHLKVLEDAGLVTNVRSGRESHYVLSPEPFNDVRHYLDAVAEQWSDALQRLKSFAETKR